MKAKDFLDLDKTNDKIILGIYVLWVVIQIILFASQGDGILADVRFFPFSEHSELEDYDYREFFCYTLTPILLFLVYKLFKPSEK